ncbi:unnamed protein product [Sympodiomycopsis kandeliae]
MAGRSLGDKENGHLPLAKNMLTEFEAEALKNTYLDARQGSRDAAKLAERLPIRQIAEQAAKQFFARVTERVSVVCGNTVQHILLDHAFKSGLTVDMLEPEGWIARKQVGSALPAWTFSDPAVVRVTTEHALLAE